MLAYVVDNFVEEEDAKLGISDLAIQRGFGIFDFLRATGQVPLFLQDHLDRFYKSAQLLHLNPIQSRAEINDIVQYLLHANALATSGIKLIVTGGYSPDGYQPATPNLLVIHQPLQLATSVDFENGIRLITCDYQRDLPTVKSINYLMGVYLRQKIVAAGADDVLYHHHGLVTELPRSNIFLVTPHNTLVTPAANVLFGITRKNILAIAPRHYTTETRNISTDELTTATEVFITSSTKRILPVISIDGKIVGDGSPGQMTRHLYKLLLSFEESYIKQYAIADG